MKLKYILPALLLSSLLNTSCDEVKQNDEINNNTTTTPLDSTQKSPDPAPQKTGKKQDSEELKFSKEDKDFLTTLDTISLGKPYSEIKKTIPTLNEKRPEGGMSQEVMQGLTEAKAVTSILNHNADVEFNYKNDTLYSYYVMLTEPDYEKADKIFEHVHKHYSKKLGECKKEKVEEENRFIRNCFWQVGNKYLSMTYNINSGTISWGYQESNPL